MSQELEELGVLKLLFWLYYEQNLSCRYSCSMASPVTYTALSMQALFQRSCNQKVHQKHLTINLQFTDLQLHYHSACMLLAQLQV